MKVKTARSATHYGHCQVCGSKQKLPTGVLSKHGYTTRWGFFSGVCKGAGHLPFEQDISLIEGMIAWALAEGAQLREMARKVAAECNPEKCWVYAYFAPSWDKTKRRGYHWIQTRIFKGRFATVMYDHPGGDDDSKETREEQLGYGHVGDLENAARQTNSGRARSIEADARQRDIYAEWQANRITDWKPQPLIPIE